MGIILFWLFRLELQNCVTSYYSLKLLNQDQKIEACIASLNQNRSKHESSKEMHRADRRWANR